MQKDDIISRQDAIKALWSLDIELRPSAIDAILNMLNSLPSAQPEIIRCKDCKHRYMEDMIWHCPFGLMGGENFFCGYGSLEAVEMGGDNNDCGTE